MATMTVKRPKPGEKLARIISMRNEIHELVCVKAVEFNPDVFEQAIAAIVAEIKVDPDMLGILPLLDANEAECQDAADYAQNKATLFFMAAEMIKKSFAEQMKLNGMVMFGGSSTEVRLVKAEPRMIIDKKLLPEQYGKFVLFPDSVKIQDALNRGITIPGVSFEEQSSMQISTIKKGKENGTSTTTEATVDSAR